MHKGVVAYIAGLIFILVATYFLTVGSHPKPTITTTILNSNAVNTTTVPQSTLSSTVPTSTVFTSCLSKSDTASIFNGDFSSGNFIGWNATGVGFGTGPSNIVYDNQNNGYYNHTWVNYNGTFFATTYRGGLVLQPGNLTSNVFVAQEPYLNFKIVSPQNNDLYIQILADGNPAIITHFDTYAAPNNQYPTSQFINASIPLSTLLCRNVSIQVVAKVTGTLATRTQYIAVGDFYQSKTPKGTAGIIINQTVR